MLAVRKLNEAKNGQPVICVSQKPMPGAGNIVVGNIGRSHLSMYKQMLAGVKAATTDFVALAEHDCLYTPEHFAWQPPCDDVFYYNTSVWFVQWASGEYSCERGRKALSQVIAGRRILQEALRQRIWFLEHGWEIVRHMAGACEFGVVSTRHSVRKSVPRQLRAEHDYAADWDEITCKDWKAEGFMTKIPNLDIRHGGNLSGRRRAFRKCYELPYWGKFLEMAAR